MAHDFRALCAELADALERLHKQSLTSPHNQVIELSNGRHPIPLGNDILLQDLFTGSLLDRARAALAEGDAGPSDEELRQLYCEVFSLKCSPNSLGSAAARFARAVLARYGATPPRPIPVAERLPELRTQFERILTVARCHEARTVGNIELAERLIDAVRGWLPTHAIPLPQENTDVQ